jgi:hypothetical protein
MLPPKMCNPNQMLTVFISYSRADILQVLQLAAALREAGFQTWVDFENLKPGERWKEAIDRALSRADALLFCLSPMSVESAWANVELKLAIAKKIRIIPIIIRGVSLDTLPHQVREVHALDLARWPSREAPRSAAKEIAISLGLGLATCSEMNDHGEFSTIWISVGDRAHLPSDVPTSAYRVDTNLIRCWHARTITDSILSEVIANSDHGRNAVIAVGANADSFETHVLIGAVAARVGEWRLTLIASWSDRVFEKSADLCRAHYIVLKPPS